MNNENNNDNMTMAQQGIGNKSPKLSDIPLPGEETGDAKAATTDEKAISKTNSLKRFFKMSGKRGEESLSGVSEAHVPPGINDIESGQPDQAKQKHTRRFHLRLGGINKHVVGEPTTAELAATSSCTTTGASGTAATGSKSGLKGSISNYWNYVFKRSVGAAKAEKPADSEDTNGKQADDDEDEEEAIETKIREEVHTLAISEESDDTTKS